MNGQYKPGDIVLGNWKLKYLIGEGSFGRVFEAEREDFGRTYKAAVKIITIPQSNSEIMNARAEGMDDKSLTAYFRSFVEEIVHEFELMSELKGTANIVSYEDHTVIQHEGNVGWDIIIRLELLTPLLNHTADRSITRQDVMKLGIDMCRALELCQKFNIVHRDIKPENIFVSKLGDYKLGDFGIARTAEKTTGMTKIGTTTYMAPEVYRGEVYGSSVDIYSLGIVLYRLLNDNRVPFLPEYPAPITHSDRDVALAKRISGAKLSSPKNADGRLAEIVLKACAYDPKDRYSSPIQMRQELDAILYNREEASLIYPKGDIAPIKSLEYIEKNAQPPNVEGETRSSLFEEEVAPDFASKVPIELREHGEIPAAPPLIPKHEVSLEDEPIAAEHTQSIFEQPASYPEPAVNASERTQSIFGKTAEDKKTEIGAKTEGDKVVIPPDLPKDDEHEPEEHKEPDEPQSFSLRLWISQHRKTLAVAAAALLVLSATAIAILSATLGTGKETSDLSQVSNNTSPTPEARVNLAVWSEWLPELPNGISNEDYIIEEKLLYRSTGALQSSEAGLEESGYTLYNVVYGDYGEWSGWQRSAVAESEAVEVETRAQSRRCNLVTRTQILPGPNTKTWIECSVCGTANTCYSNWTEYRYKQREITYCYYLEGDWSEFSDQPIGADDSVLVNTKPMYRYIPKDAVEEEPESMSNFPTQIGDYTGYFADVDDNKWYGSRKTGYAGFATQLGAIVPNEYLAFRPEENLTIAEAIKAAVVINRIYSGEPGILAETSDWYQVYVDYAIDNGMIEDYDFTDYTAEATRQEAAYIFSTALPESELTAVNNVSSITDIDSNSRNYRSVYLLARAGIIDWPAPDYSFNAEAYMTRAETAALIARLVKPGERIINS